MHIYKIDTSLTIIYLPTRLNIITHVSGLLCTHETWKRHSRQYDRYIRLRSHNILNISHRTVSRLRRSHFITFSGNICFQFTRESWQKTETLITPSSTSFAFAKAGSFKRAIYSNVRLDWQIFIDIFKFSFHYSFFHFKWVNNQINQIKESLIKQNFQGDLLTEQTEKFAFGSRVEGRKMLQNYFWTYFVKSKFHLIYSCLLEFPVPVFTPYSSYFRCLCFWPGHRCHVVITLQSSK